MSVRKRSRVSTDFAEGRYVLRRGSVRTFSRVPTAFLNEQPYHRSHCMCVNMSFSTKGIRSLIMPYHEVPESQKCSAYSRYPYNLEPAHNFLAVSPKAHFCQTGARPSKKNHPAALHGNVCLMEDEFSTVTCERTKLPISHIPFPGSNRPRLHGRHRRQSSHGHNPTPRIPD